MKSTPFVVNVASLRARPGVREEIERKGGLEELATSGASVDPTSDVEFRGVIEAIEGHHVIAKGHIHAHWSGECRRCLNEAAADIDVDAREIFEDEPTEGETYPIDRESIDLEPMIREAVMLDIPIAPLCKPDCAGLCPECGVDRNTQSCNCVVDLGDPRWAALDALKDED